MGSLEIRLKELREQIDETELNLKICASHVEFMHDMRKRKFRDKNLVKTYENQMGQDAYRRMILQDKLRKLMEESFSVQEKILNGDEDE